MRRLSFPLRFRAVSVPLAAAAVLCLSASAHAGGWAITTLDPLPQDMAAGQTYQVGYVIRQHGQTPATFATPQIRISQATTQFTFQGRPEGGPGHFVSDVTFPTDGAWTWTVDQTPFASQALGSIAIQPVAVPEPAPPAAPVTRSPAPVEIALAGIALLVLLSVGGLLVRVRRTCTLRPSSREPGRNMETACLEPTMRRARAV
jgi:hypothetical protein